MWWLRPLPALLTRCFWGMLGVVESRLCVSLRARSGAAAVGGWLEELNGSHLITATGVDGPWTRAGFTATSAVRCGRTAVRLWEGLEEGYSGALWRGCRCALIVFAFVRD